MLKAWFDVAEAGLQTSKPLGVEEFISVHRRGQSMGTKRNNGHCRTSALCPVVYTFFLKSLFGD